MHLLGHEGVAAVSQSADDLRAIGASAVRLLAKAVEHQGVQRQKASKYALDLENPSFYFSRGDGA